MPSKPALPLPRTFFSVQYLRGLAALTVIFWHALSQLSRSQPHLAYPEWGAVAVDMFFVISGFVMWHMTAGQAHPLKGYARKRIVRVVPFYWAATSIVVLTMVFAPHLLSSSRFDFDHVVASLFFIAWPHPVLHGQMLPVIIPGWTLNYEIFFYVVLGFCLMVPVRQRALAVIAALLGIALLPAVITSGSPLFYFYTQPLIVEFASGVGLGWLVWNGYRMRGAAALLLVLGGLAIVPFLPSPGHVVTELGQYRDMLRRVLEYVGPAFAIVGGAVFFELAHGVPKWRPLKVLGDASYSVYLIHPLVLPAVTRAWGFAGLSARPEWNAAYLLLAVAVAAVAGVICHFTVEMPLTRFFTRLTEPRPQPRLGMA